MITKQEWRQALALILTHAGWWGAFGLSLWMTTTDRAGDDGWRLLVIVCVGIAIAAGSALGRMRLTEAILGAFKAGMDATKDGLEERLDYVAKEAVEEIKEAKNDK